MQPRRVNFHTLGCKLNFSESSTLAREFERGGFVRVAPTAEADICVINSCSVTEHADKKCRNLIRKLHRRNPAAIIAVTGCYAQLKPQEIAAIEGVDIVLSNNDKGALFKRGVELSGKAGRRCTAAKPIRSRRSSRPFRAATARAPSWACRTGATNGLL